MSHLVTPTGEHAVEDLTGKSRLVSNVLTSWVAQILIIVAGFFLPRVIDQELGQASLGIWDFAWSIVSYINLAHLGIGAALNRYVAKYRVENNSAQLRIAISTTIAIQWTIAAAVAIASVLISAYLPALFEERLHGHSDTAQGVVLYLGLSIAVLLLFDTSRGVLTGCHRWDLFNAVNSVTQILGTLAMIAVIMMGGTLVQVSMAYLGVMLVQGVARSFMARRVCPEFGLSVQMIQLEFAREIFTYGVRSILVNIPGLLALQASYIAAAAALGPAALAVLARPFALLRYIETFLTRFTYVLTPMAESVLAVEGKDKLSKFALDTTSYAFAFAIPPILTLAIFGDDIIRLWMGPDYVNQLLIWIIAGMGLLTSFHSPLLRIIIGLDRHGEAAGKAILLVVTLFGIGMAIGFQQNWFSLEFFAWLIAICSVSVSTFYIPQYACRQLELKGSVFLRAIFNRSAIFALTAGAVVGYVDYTVPMVLKERALLLLVYLVLVAVVYLYLLVPPDTRQRFNIFRNRRA